MLSVIVILSCDKVENIGKKLCNTCRNLQAISTDEAVSSELKCLAQVLENLSPRFKAAGFVIINRNIIFGICSIITSNLIVALQFHLKFAEIPNGM